MIYLKKAGKVLFWLLIAALLVAPLGLIFEISSREMEQYALPSMPVFVESAYGSIVQSERKNVADYITVAGSFSSDTSVYVELTQKSPDRIRWEASPGDELQVGQTLGAYDGTPILSEHAGVLEEISVYGEDPYIKIRLLCPVVLEFYASPKVITALENAKELITAENEAVTVSYIAQIRQPDDTALVKLSIDSDAYHYGQRVEDLKIFTGHEYLKALVLSQDCVYQKQAGEDQPWYVRQVTQNGVFIGEIEVGIGYSNGDLVCVIGIEEGQYFDSGYKALIEGS